jgi:phosphatidylglycerophosphatase A
MIFALFSPSGRLHGPLTRAPASVRRLALESPQGYLGGSSVAPPTTRLHTGSVRGRSSGIEDSRPENPKEIRPVGAEPGPGYGASGALGGPALWIGTAGGLGYAPIAPGTVGSAGAVLLFLLFPWLELSIVSRLGLLLTTTAVVVVIGTWAAGRCEQAWGRKDDGRIVIDEVAGQLLTLVPVLALATSGVPDVLARGSQLWWLLVVTAFVAFRGLDIWKPGPVRWAERTFSGGWGVMADDLVAGAIGGVLMTVPCFALLVLALSGALTGLVTGPPS